MIEVVTGIVILVMVGGCAWAAHEGGYRRGQIDAFNGVVRFKKFINKDGETIWDEIKNKGCYEKSEDEQS